MNKEIVSKEILKKILLHRSRMVSHQKFHQFPREAFSGHLDVEPNNSKLEQGHWPSYQSLIYKYTLHNNCMDI